MNDRLDHWLPNPVIRTHHRKKADASPEELWAAAKEIRIEDTRRLGPLVHWRIPGLEDSSTYYEFFSAYPFSVLDETETALVSGMAGKIWTLARDYPELDGPEAFAGWNEAGTVRVAIAHGVNALSDGRGELWTEARVKPIDARARLRLRAVWAVVSPFERLVALEPLALAVRRAEQ